MFCVLCKERTKSLKIPFRMTIPLKKASQKPLKTAITKCRKTNLLKNVKNANFEEIQYSIYLTTEKLKYNKMRITFKIKRLKRFNKTQHK